MNRRHALLAAGATFLTGCASGGVRTELALSRDIDAAITRAMTSAGAPGLAVAVYTPDGGYARGFGVTDVATGERVDADTSFYIASSTKALTSLALTILHQRGAFDLDATLAGYAPDAPFPSEARAPEAHFRNLLAHTGGIANGPIAYRSAISGQHNPETLWRLLGSSRVNAQAPLGQFQYTNVGYNIATILTDRHLGLRWQDLLEREIFNPAGMHRSSARMSRAVAGGWKIARPHLTLSASGPARSYLEKIDETMQSAGGVIMSANDALRWLQLMATQGRIGARQVMAPEVIAESGAPIADVNAEYEVPGIDSYVREHYGLGWYRGPYRGETLLHSFGSFSGFRSHVSYMPARGAGVAVFVNDGALSSPIIDYIARFIYDRLGGHADADARLEEALTQLTALRAAAIPQMEAERARRAQRTWTLTRPRAAYAGVYENDLWGRIEISVQDEAIQVRQGAVHAIAEPFTRPDSLRVELEPGSGRAIMFQGDGDRPSALVLDDEQFTRVS